MGRAEARLKTLDAGRVLDVATGSGNFIHFLIDTLRSFGEIVGLDSSAKNAAAFASAFEGRNIHFLQADAAHTDLPSASFDTVCISNSLHHMADLPAVLAEMTRLLRPGGTFLLAEMYRDDQSEAQRTHVLLHHWWAAVDTAGGVHHGETFTRQQVLDLAGGLGLEDLCVEPSDPPVEDPHDPGTIQYLEGIIDQYLERAKGLPGEEALRLRGEELRARLKQAGFHSAASLLICGTKPAA